jgi:Tfp pilus assembly protein PilP
VEELHKSLFPLLKLIPGCESVNDDDIREWMNQDEEQTTDDNMADHASDAGNTQLKMIRI